MNKQLYDIEISKIFILNPRERNKQIAGEIRKNIEDVGLKRPIRLSDAPELKVGDKIETDDETFAVYSEPICDIHRLVWSCDLVCV